MRAPWLAVALAVTASAGLSLALHAAGERPARVASPAPSANTPARTTTPAPNRAPAWVAAARRQVGVTLHYDPAYVVLPYPGGDVPLARGVCTDVVIRAFRAVGFDLQREVHEDMRSAFDAYPRLWGLRKPDRNIDHRRVPNLQVFFTRRGWALPDDAALRPGDVVTWMLPGNLPHIGIVSDRAVGGTPLILHNIGAGTVEDDILHRYRITGRYRPVLAAPR